MKKKNIATCINTRYLLPLLDNKKNTKNKKQTSTYVVSAESWVHELRRILYTAQQYVPYPKRNFVIYALRRTPCLGNSPNPQLLSTLAAVHCHIHADTRSSVYTRAKSTRDRKRYRKTKPYQIFHCTSLRCCSPLRWYLPLEWPQARVKRGTTNVKHWNFIRQRAFCFVSKRVVNFSDIQSRGRRVYAKTENLRIYFHLPVTATVYLASSPTAV